MTKSRNRLELDEISTHGSTVIENDQLINLNFDNSSSCSRISSSNLAQEFSQLRIFLAERKQ